ncbi:Protein F29B9.7 [Aphelenchoides fujianensis]|nr:Protein F29B9.7 [Aphelenchoides fujianensis]KAI6225448.1 Protein F29B9.7 [Aphelenchoides fujianensis]
MWPPKKRCPRRPLGNRLRGSRGLLAALDTTADTRSVHSTASDGERGDPNGGRFVATVGALLSFGLLGRLLNALLLTGGGFVSLLAVAFALLVAEWNRLHGSKLTRDLRPVLDVASVLATYQEFDPLFARLYDADKQPLFACCGEGPPLNPDLPRTADEISERANADEQKREKA